VVSAVVLSLSSLNRRRIRPGQKLTITGLP
jgi:hypothetical protein